MKNKLLLSLVLSFLIYGFLAIIPENTALAQATQMSYNISSGPFYPVSGSTNQLEAKIDYNDSTHTLNAFDFEVYLHSFVNNLGNQNLLAALGAASFYPYMSFESRRIKEESDQLVINGTLYFRGIYNPVTLYAQRNDNNDSIKLNGEFTLNVRDYYPMATPLNRLPTYVNLNFQATFDKAEIIKDTED